MSKRDAVVQECRVCGASLVPVLNRSILLDDEESAVQAGRAVFIPHMKVNALPQSACVLCHPDWLKVNVLGKRYRDLQLEKEELVADSGDLKKAGRILDVQRELRAELSDLVNRLITAR